MSEFSRRSLLAASAAGAMVAATAEAAGQGMPPSGPTPPLLAGTELPSFRFRLGAVTPKAWDGGWAKEATVAQFPVSQAIAGVLMSLVPGGLRELHWHANAAEWAYVIRGQCSVTTIDPRGRSEIADFSPGDVWYFPRGYGHSIQGIGREDCLFVLVFDNGYFSEFGTFSISDWIGHTPPEVLAKLRPLHRERRQRRSRVPDRAQQRRLSVDLAQRLGRGQPALAAGDQLRGAGGDLRRFPQERALHAGVTSPQPAPTSASAAATTLRSSAVSGICGATGSPTA
jgi:oxalate decarboxylase/phosphoglucose isomerase-like protein (cupin superfamily)